MPVRAFEWRDIPELQRQRQNNIYLNSELLFTRGPLLLPAALISFLAPEMGVFMGVSGSEKKGKTEVIGQIAHTLGSFFAYLTFLTPGNAIESQAFNALLEYLIFQSGERGATHLLADVDEQTTAFDVLHNDNFSIYARQRIWEFAHSPHFESIQNTWRSVKRSDVFVIRSMYNDLVPGLVKQVEPFSDRSPRGLVYFQGDELMAYAEIKYGLRGIWIQPFVHPGAEDMLERFVDLIHKVPKKLSRPIYFCVRSYQSWLEPFLEELGAETSPSQAVMVRHLAVKKKALRPFAIPSVEGRQPEITTPISHLESR